MGKKILVLGGGGREHALCWKLKQSPLVEMIYCAPGNGGIAAEAECVALKDCPSVLEFCRKEAIDLVVVGSEQPLVEGWADTLAEAGIAVFGPSAKAARLEGSKAFTKELCRKYGIPTAAYEVFSDAVSAKEYLRSQRYPLVVKADGLAAGKGVVIAQGVEEATSAVDAMMQGEFGAAGKRIVIEEFLQGEEASFFALSDGKTAVEFEHAQDHKRAYDGDRGPNTGGMGAYSPAPVLTPALRKEVMERIILPTIEATAREGAPFRGVLFAGLMLTAAGPRLLEYNVRFGDPETQALMRRLDSDLYLLLSACAEGSLAGVKPEFSSEASLCVVMAAKGYPKTYEKGSRIGGLEAASAIPGAVVFHAGTAQKGGIVIAEGGRVLGITGVGKTIAEAKATAYCAVDCIDWPEGFCRRDIGWRAIKAP